MEQTNNNSMNGVDWNIFDEHGYDIRPSMNKSRGVCKVDFTDPSLASKYYLTQEELDFLGKFITPNLTRGPLFDEFLEDFRCRDLYYIRLWATFDSIRFCQSSFSSYSHLADQDEIEEERSLYESDDVLEHGFYAKEIRRWQMEDERRWFHEETPLPESPVDTNSRLVNIELLGCYFPYHSNDNEVPEVHLFMDNITETARRLCVPRWYIVVAVFLHEMCHAYFDRFPFLLPKPYIPEIEEPIAECLSLQILYCFAELSRFFYPNGELLDVFDTAYSMVYSKRRLKKRCYYSLGIELFHSDYKVGSHYNRYSYFLKEQSQGVNNYIAQFASGFPQQPYTCVPMLADLLNYGRR